MDIKFLKQHEKRESKAEKQIEREFGEGNYWHKKVNPEECMALKKS